MTDRVNHLTVVLHEPTRDDDVECIVDAIRMIRGVLSVKANVLSAVEQIAVERFRRDYIQKLFELANKE